MWGDGIQHHKHRRKYRKKAIVKWPVNDISKTDTKMHKFHVMHCKCYTKRDVDRLCLDSMKGGRTDTVTAFSIDSSNKFRNLWKEGW